MTERTRVGRRVYEARPPLAWIDTRLPCRKNPDLFYSQDHAEQLAARTMCLACPVMAECLADVLTWPSDLRMVGMTCGGGYWPSSARVRRARDEVEVEREIAEREAVKADRRAAAAAKARDRLAQSGARSGIHAVVERKDR